MCAWVLTVKYSFTTGRWRQRSSFTEEVGGQAAERRRIRCGFERVHHETLSDPLQDLLILKGVQGLVQGQLVELVLVIGTGATISAIVKLLPVVLLLLEVLPTRFPPLSD